MAGTYYFISSYCMINSHCSMEIMSSKLDTYKDCMCQELC